MYQVRKAIKESADDVIILIDYYTAKDQLDPGRIAVLGISMGGCVTFRTLVIEDRIKLALPIIGTPYWEDIPGDSCVADAVYLRERFDRFAKEYNPANNPEFFFPGQSLSKLLKKINM